jgi:hypothetical protein
MMTAYRFDQISSSLRNNTGSTIASTLQPTAPQKYTLATKCELTYADTRRMLQNNVLSEKGSNRLISWVDSSLIVAVKTPMTCRTLSTNAWIEDYMSALCDKDPEEIKFFSPENAKQDVYLNYWYVVSCNYVLLNISLILFSYVCFSVYSHISNDWRDKGKEAMWGKPVTKVYFYELWSSLYPHLALRDKCNITGTCAICSRIDEGRRSSGGDRHVKEAFRTAHELHRGYAWLLPCKN